MSKVPFILILLTLVVDATELPKPSYARTMLKVSRSLPGETEELKVRTSEGNVATLIVKRREKSSFASNEEESASRIIDDLRAEASSIEENINNSSVRQNETLKNGSTLQDETKELVKAQIAEIRAKVSKSGKEATTETSENAEIGVLPGSISDTNIDYGNWTPLGEDGRALKLEETTTEEYHNWKPLRSEPKIASQGRASYVRFSDSKFMTDGLVLMRNFQDRAQRNLNVDKHQTERNSEGSSEEYVFLPHQQRQPIKTNSGDSNYARNKDVKNVPPEVVVRSEINVKSQPRRSPMSLDSDGTPVIHGKRVPDEPLDKIQTWRNARVINNKLVAESSTAPTLETAANYYSDNSVDRQRFERFFKDVNRRYGRNYEETGRNVYFEWDPKNYKNEDLKAEVYEPLSDNYRPNVQKRMLHHEGVVTYPNSQLYTPESQKAGGAPVKAGVRAPVLQYAHPELGVQPAKIVKNEKRRPDVHSEVQQYSNNVQHLYGEQRQKKKYVLNDKNFVDTYTMKNYYPNQHFYGLKRPNDAPFWVKISENLKNQFSSGVEKVSQFTKPVFDPLVEATHKISQNLGLSKGKEAQDKVGTVASGSSILIPALGLVASGAALGIGAVAVGRYLDVDVLKRSNDEDVKDKRAFHMDPSYLKGLEDRANGATSSLENSETPDVIYVVEDDEKARFGGASVEPSENKDTVLLTENLGKEEPREKEENDGQRNKRSVDYLDIFNTENNAQSAVAKDEKLQRKGVDSITEIVEIDLPTEGNIDVTEFLIPRKKTNKWNRDVGTIYVIEDDSMRSEIAKKEVQAKTYKENELETVAELTADVMETSETTLQRNYKRNEAKINEKVSSSRRRRSVAKDQEIEDLLQNLENTEIAEVAHINGDWTNTPCAKRLFCDAMIQRGADASILMEKKMTGLLGLIQPGAAMQVSNHFEEVMDAVRRHDCSHFVCSLNRPANVFY